MSRVASMDDRIVVDPRICLENAAREETPTPSESSPYDAFFALAGQDVVDLDAYKRLREASMI